MGISHIVRRGKFTDLLLADIIANTPSPTIWGDGEAPESGGWTGQQPGKGTFTPYQFLETMAAVPNMAETLARRHEASWRLMYAVTGVGATRNQCEAALDVTRAYLSALHGKVYAAGQDSEVFKVQQSSYMQLGAVSRDDGTDPATWECRDTLEIWIDKR